VGDRTLYWYSLWRGTEGTGVRMVSWERDRLGYLQPVRAGCGRVVSGAFEVAGGQAEVCFNVSGLGEHSGLRVDLVDDGFQPIPGFSGTDAARVSENGLSVPLRWHGGRSFGSEIGKARLDIRFDGLRSEDARLYAVYLREK